MPGSLGGLVVSLGLNAAEFTSGLTKAEREAQKFAQAMERGVASAANAAGIAFAAVGAAATAAFIAIDKFAKEAAQFQDLSEKTGASAESLASFATAAAVAGTSMDTVANISVKLSKALSGIDDETKAAGAAFKALGINVAQFKQLTPDQQIVALAKALNQFGDGSGKTAAAIAILGKAGADALPFLKELAQGVGQVTILTDAQIQRADAYADAQAAARKQLELYAQAAATEALPAITALTGVVTDLIKAMLGINDQATQLPSAQIRTFAENAARLLAFIADAADGVAQAFQVVAHSIAAGAAQAVAIAKLQFAEALRIQKQFEANIAKIKGRENVFSGLLEERLALQRAMEQGPPSPPKKNLDFNPPKTGTGGAAALSEAQRFLESLQKQLEVTQDLSTEQKVLNEIRERGLVGLTPALEAQILATAREIDAEKALKKAIEESRKAFEEERRAAEAAQKQRDRDADAAGDVAQRILDGNRALQDEIEIIKGGDEARVRLEQQRINDAINIAEEARALALLDPLRALEADNIRIQIEALEKRKALLSDRQFALQMRKDAEELQRFKNVFADTFADAFASFIDGSKSASQAFKDFAKSVEQQITRLAAQNIGNAIFGGTNTGGFDIGKIIGMLLGGATGGGGSWVSGGDIGGLAGGTSFWKGGPTVVGESGPEVVNLPRGAGVVPNEESQKMFGPRMNFVINVLPGASTKTAQQAAAMTGVAVQRAMVRNT